MRVCAFLPLRAVRIDGIVSSFYILAGRKNLLRESTTVRRTKKQYLMCVIIAQLLLLLLPLIEHTITIITRKCQNVTYSRLEAQTSRYCPGRIGVVPIYQSESPLNALGGVLIVRRRQSAVCSHA